MGGKNYSANECSRHWASKKSKTVQPLMGKTAHSRISKLWGAGDCLG